MSTVQFSCGLEGLMRWCTMPGGIRQICGAVRPRMPATDHGQLIP